MWTLLAAGLILIAVGGLSIWLIKHLEEGGAAREKVDVRDKDLKFREKFDEAGQEWDVGGGLAGRARRVRGSRRRND